MILGYSLPASAQRLAKTGLPAVALGRRRVEYGVFSAAPYTACQPIPITPGPIPFPPHKHGSAGGLEHFERASKLIFTCFGPFPFQGLRQFHTGQFGFAVLLVKFTQALAVGPKRGFQLGFLPIQMFPECGHARYFAGFPKPVSELHDRFPKTRKPIRWHGMPQDRRPIFKNHR